MWWLKRHLQPVSVSYSLKAGFGAGISIGCLYLLSDLSNEVLLMAPFGASCVLLFSVPQSPLSQPTNLIGGHLLSSIVALFFVQFMPDSLAALPLSILAAIGLMAWFRVTHPPAGADPIVIVLGQHSWYFLLFPVFVGSLLLFLLAILHHKFLTKIPYPTKIIKK